jgi:hypothetical protein
MMTNKPPYEVDVRKHLPDKQVLFIIDEERLEERVVPRCFKGIIKDYGTFERTFAEGASEIVFENPFLVYRLESDQIRGDYRLLWYKKV